MIEFNWVYKRVLQELHFVWAARGLKFKGCAVQAVKQTPNKSSNDNSAQGEGVYDSVGGERRSVHQHISLAHDNTRPDVSKRKLNLNTSTVGFRLEDGLCCVSRFEEEAPTPSAIGPSLSWVPYFTGDIEQGRHAKPGQPSCG